MKTGRAKDEKNILMKYKHRQKIEKLNDNVKSFKQNKMEKESWVGGWQKIR